MRSQKCSIFYNKSQIIINAQTLVIFKMYKIKISPLVSCIAFRSTGIFRATLRICVRRQLGVASQLGGISDTHDDVELECTTSSFKFVGLPTKVISSPKVCCIRLA